MAATPPQTSATPPPIGGNRIIRAATRRRYAASQLLMLQNPHRYRQGDRRGHGEPGRSTHERRQGAAIARQLARGLRQSKTLFAQQQPHRIPSVQNSPSTSRTAPLPVQNSPSTPEMAQFGAFSACRESFVPFSPPRSRAGRVLYRTQGRVGASHDTTTGTTSAEGTGGTTGTRRMTGGLRQDHRQTNFACNSPTARSNTSSKTAEYQRSDFKT